MEQNLKKKLINREIKKPSPFLMSVVMGLLGILNKKYNVKFSYDYDLKSLPKDQPTILLSSHSSRLEFVYTLYGFKRKDVNMVVGYQNILKKGMYTLFLKLGIISKYLYQPDIVSLKQIFKVLKRNGAVGVFPEGIQSTSGSTHPINPATAQFIKHSKANVVIATSKGAYLATNRYSKDRKKGYIGIEYSWLFTPEKLENLTEEQIYQTLLEKIGYNDFAFNKVARNKYVGKKPNAYGLDKILYKCPDCHKEFTLSVDNESIKCNHCGFKAKVNEYYDLILEKGNTVPEDIDKWYKWQRKEVAKEVVNGDFSLSLTGSLCELKTDKLRKSPKDRNILTQGKITLTPKGLFVEGSLNGETANYEFDAKSIYSLTCSTKGYLEFFSNNDYFMIIPKDNNQYLIKWTLASEEIHNLYDEKWQKACKDVYDYDGGENNE